MENEESANNTLSTVRRSSVTRRLQPLSDSSTTRQRARSEERNIPEPDSDEEGEIIEQSHSPKGLTRIDSDPLDSPGAVVKEQRSVSLQNEEEKSPKKKSTHDTLLPTLPRYPIAVTKNHNCWSEPHAGKCFKVRGGNYLNDKKKVESGPYIFPARGADLILTNRQSGNGADIAKRQCVLNGQVRSVPTL